MINHDDMYDVHSYSEKELFDILDLFHPTDRELEAKILGYIDKYSSDSNNSKDSIRLHTFFVDIYKRFFDIEHDLEDEFVEGYENPTTNPNPTQNLIPTQNPNPTPGNVQLISSLTYAQGNLNPILTQTIKKTITVDSQFRDSKSSVSTQFTFNFTETLKDVLSLKLFAVQIPYTWYTISQSYGSNFIYIKGNVKGIDNGLHDISINIPPGNYTLSTINNISSNDTGTSISGAIQTAFRNLSNIYTDISFGNTNLLYNVNSCKATFNIDIQKHYNESYYRLNFPGTFYSPVSDTNRTKNIGCFLGFNSPNYSTSSFYSVRNVSNTLDNSVTKYAFDTTNNYIYIIQYYTDATQNYIPGVSTVYQKIKIEFPISIGGLKSSQYSIYKIVNDTIMADSRLNRPDGIIDSSVNLIPIQGKDKDGNTFDNSGNSFFQWQIKLNRYNGYNIPQSKLALEVPSVETTGTNPIWIGSNSCFYFDTSLNEINNLISETLVFSSNFEIKGNAVANKYIYYSLKCNESDYNQRGENDFSYNLTDSIGSGYSFNGYLSEINAGFTKINSDFLTRNKNNKVFNVPVNSATVTSPSVSQSVAYYNTEDSRFHMSIDMNKYLFTENFRIDIGNTFLSSTLNFSTTELNGTTTLSDGMTFTAESDAKGNYNGTGTETILMNIYPDENYTTSSGNSNSYKNGISSTISYVVKLPKTPYIGVGGLTTGLNSVFREFSDVTGSYPLSDMNIVITSLPNNRVRSVLTINVKKIMTESSYTINFKDDTVTNYDLSTWSKNLKLLTSYNLNLFSRGSFSDISGNGVINSDRIDLTQGGNQFELVPIDEGVTGAGTILFDIPASEYNRIQLFETMNTLFDSREETRGTRISYIVTANNTEFTKIRWNINKVYTSKDYKLVFYDLYSFVSCFLGNSSVRNATWDTTLGWIMGFHKFTEYPLILDNLRDGYYYDAVNAIITGNPYSVDAVSVPFRTIITLTGDTTVSVNLYNYFMVILDDFNASHLNDGLVSITQTDTNLSLPSYANRAKYICDPATKRILNTGITDIASNNLTQNQVYSINQIINTQNTPKSFTSQGVYVSDIFGLIPIKTSGYSPGQVYVELGGTLQSQDRTYFGPVNIHRMAISLLNDRGEVVDLNGANWSLQFICEQLYQNNSKK